MKLFIIMLCLLTGVGYGLFSEGYYEGIYDKKSFTYKKAFKYWERGFDKGREIEAQRRDGKDWLTETMTAQNKPQKRVDIFSVVDKGE